MITMSLTPFTLAYLERSWLASLTWHVLNEQCKQVGSRQERDDFGPPLMLEPSPSQAPQQVNVKRSIVRRT